MRAECFRLLVGRVAEEGADGGQAQVAAAGAVAAFLLHRIEESADHRRLQIGERQGRGRLVQLLLDKVKQQTEGIAVGSDGVSTGTPLRHEALGEEAFEQAGKADGVVHDQPSQRFSRRRVANPISSG